jgi:hypothetical protein
MMLALLLIYSCSLYDSDQSPQHTIETNLHFILPSIRYSNTFGSASIMQITYGSSYIYLNVPNKTYIIQHLLQII